MIWCVDDDEAIRDIEVYTLKSTGFEARGFADGAELIDALGKEKPELIVLDIMLPGDDGITILKKIRQMPSVKDVPVIMATAKGMEIDKIQGLDNGADDYLVKPFGMMEMLSRIKAVLRRYNRADENSVLTLKGITLNTEERTITVDGSRVIATYKEFELLKLFLTHPGTVFSREKLFAEIWGMDYCGETRTVDMHIRTLRQKLGIYGNLIETVRNVGYRLEVKK